MATFDGADWPVLTDPVLVAGFEGWNDAGDAASGAIEHLELVWHAEPLTELDPDDYYDFQVNRPDRLAGRRRQPPDQLADHAVLDLPAAGRGVRSGARCAGSSPTCAGGRSAASCSA